MALQKIKIPIAVNTPLETKSDEFLTPGFSTIENARHSKTGGLIKRRGYTKLTNTVSNSSAGTTFNENISNALALKTYKNELLLLSKDSLFSYSSSNIGANLNSWITRDFSNVSGTTSPERRDSSVLTAVLAEYPTIVSYDAILFSPKYIETSDYKITLSSSRAYSYLNVRDAASGATICDRTLPINRSSIATDSTYLYVVGAAFNGDLQYYAIPLGNFNIDLTLTSVVKKITGLSFLSNDVTTFDIVSNTSNVFLTVAHEVSSQFYAKAYILVGNTYTLTATTSLGSGYTTLGPMEMSLVRFQTGFRLVFASVESSSPSGNLQMISYNDSGAYVSGPTVIDSNLNCSYVSVTADSTYTYYIYKRFPGIVINKIDATGTSTITDFYPRGVPQTKATIYDGHIYVGIRSDNYTNLGHFIILRKNLNKSTPASLFAKALDFTYAPITVNNNGGSTLYVVGFPEMHVSGSIISTAANSFTDIIPPSLITETNGTSLGSLPNRTQIIEMNVGAASYESISVEAGYHVSGSIVKFYDGNSFTELGFLETPRIFNVSSIDDPLGDFPVGTYEIAACYVWVDNNGVTHRSAPGFASITLASPTENITFSVTNLTLTEKNNVYIEYYLTQASQEILYKYPQKTASSRGDLNYNMAFQAPASTDAEILYTVSGEVVNDAPTACLGIAEYRGRIFTVSKKSLQYSKPVEAGYPVEFNGDQVINLAAEGGDAAGIRAMDSNLIIFKRNAVFLLAGEGPNALGQQNDYGNPQIISSDNAGVEDYNSVINYPNGILFKSAKGFYEINRGLAVSYIGGPVAEFNQFRVISSELLTHVNEIRFVLNNGNILVYDYQERQWEVDTLTNTIGATSVNNVYYKVDSSNIVTVENSLYFDNYQEGQSVVPYSMKVTTNWIQVSATNNGVNISGGLQQWQRIYAIHILGRYKSEHELKVSLAYDYDNTVVDIATIQPTSNGLYQYKVNPSIQKCQSIKITIEDVNSSLTNGESLELSSILLEVGIKGTAQKQGANSKAAPAT